MCVCACTCECRCPLSPQVSDPLVLELQAVVSPLMWLLGAELWSSALLCMFLATEPALRSPCFYISTPHFGLLVNFCYQNRKYFVDLLGHLSLFAWDRLSHSSAWNSLYLPGWFHIYSNLPASAPWKLGLQVWPTTPTNRQTLWIIKQYISNSGKQGKKCITCDSITLRSPLLMSDEYSSKLNTYIVTNTQGGIYHH